MVGEKDQSLHRGREGSWSLEEKETLDEEAVDQSFELVHKPVSLLSTSENSFVFQLFDAHYYLFVFFSGLYNFYLFHYLHNYSYGD